MHHLANLKDYTGTEIHEILTRAKQIKANPGHYQESLKGKSLAMLFQKTSTRTRVSFEVAMTELGGHSIFIDWRSSNFILSGIQHEIEYLSRNVSCIMARMLKTMISSKFKLPAKCLLLMVAAKNIIHARRLQTYSQ